MLQSCRAPIVSGMLASAASAHGNFSQPYVRAAGRWVGYRYDQPGAASDGGCGCGVSVSPRDEGAWAGMRMHWGKLSIGMLHGHCWSFLHSCIASLLTLDHVASRMLLCDVKLGSWNFSCGCSCETCATLLACRLNMAVRACHGFMFPEARAERWCALSLARCAWALLLFPIHPDPAKQVAHT